jgi:hypothetical protein
MSGVRAIDWLDDNAARADGGQRASADIIKVVAALVVVAAAILVAAGLLADPGSSGARLAARLLAAAVALALLVVVVDRRVAVDERAVLTRAQLYEWDDARLLSELRVMRQAAANVNESVVKAAAWTLGAEVLVAVAAGVAATVALL